MGAMYMRWTGRGGSFFFLGFVSLRQASEFLFDQLSAPRQEFRRPEQGANGTQRETEREATGRDGGDGGASASRLLLQWSTGTREIEQCCSLHCRVPEAEHCMALSTVSDDHAGFAVEGADGDAFGLVGRCPTAFFNGETTGREALNAFFE